jgi:hypothetical protein
MGGMRLPLDRARLSVALGRDNVVHMALTDAAAADRVASLIARLLRFSGMAETSDADFGSPAGAAMASPAAATTMTRPERADTN